MSTASAPMLRRAATSPALLTRRTPPHTGSFRRNASHADGLALEKSTEKSFRFRLLTPMTLGAGGDRGVESRIHRVSPTRAVQSERITDGRDSARWYRVSRMAQMSRIGIRTHQLCLIDLVFVNREILANHRGMYCCANIGKNRIAAEKPFGFGQTGDAVGTRLLRTAWRCRRYGKSCAMTPLDGDAFLTSQIKDKAVCAQCLFKRKRRAGRNRFTALLELLQRVCLLVGQTRCCA